MNYNRILLSLTTTAISTIPISSIAKTNTPSKPNVIFILMDDAGYGDWGCYGQIKTETPNIDALAKQGIRFVNMYAGAPLSSPSRCGLLTGLHSGHAQIRANDEMTWRGDVWNHEAMLLDPLLEGQAPMKAGTITLGTMMKKAGYATAMVGKWGVGGPGTESLPNKMGFDFYYGCLCQRQAHNYYPPFLWKNDKREYLDNELICPDTPLDEGADPRDPHSYDKYTKNVYAPDAMYKELLDFVENHQKEPFFLMWTTPIPHSPMSAPRKAVDYYVKKFGDEDPIEGKGYYPCRYPRATYAAMLSYIDKQIGDLVKKLKKMKIYDNTLFIITSDNGPANNSCSPTVWFDSAFPFKCGKGWGKASLHEGGIRMPFIASWGNHLKPSVSHHIGYFPDVMPTLCDIAGIEIPTTDGLSIYPTLTGKIEQQKEHEFLYWEFPGGKGWVAVRWGKWKGLLMNVKSGNKKMQLFDLENDDRETTDVASQHPEIVERMWKYILSSHQDIENPLFQMSVTRQ